MRRSFTRVLSAVLLAGASIAVTVTAANARTYAHEDHCFPNGPTTDIRHVEDDYADGTLRDGSTVEAVEALNSRLWKLRLSGLPLEDARDDFLNNRDAYRDRFLQSRGDYYDPAPWHSGYGLLRLRDAAERDSRRTGSKYLYVTPAQKELGRQRSIVRAYKQKPCNPNIIYLGTN